MKLVIRIRRTAQDELESSMAWYEKAKPGLGFLFAQAVRNVLEMASHSPKRFPTIEGDVREAIVLGFPFCVYFRVRRSQLIVIAIYHQSRDPDGWKQRV